MRFKSLINPILAMIVVGVGLAWRYNASNQTAQQPEKQTVKVLVTQLPAENNVVPVEIIQATAVSSAPNFLDDVSYVIKNNSGKAISAVAVAKKILYREGGKLLGASS